MQPQAPAHNPGLLFLVLAGLCPRELFAFPESGRSSQPLPVALSGGDLASPEDSNVFGCHSWDVLTGI